MNWSQVAVSNPIQRCSHASVVVGE